MSKDLDLLIMRNIEHEENLLFQCDTFGQVLSECKKTYTEANIEDMCCDWIFYDLFEYIQKPTHEMVEFAKCTH